MRFYFWFLFLTGLFFVHFAVAHDALRIYPETETYTTGQLVFNHRNSIRYNPKIERAFPFLKNKASQKDKKLAKGQGDSVFSLTGYASAGFKRYTQKGAILFDVGLNFEKSLQSQIHLNQASLGYEQGIYTLKAGRMLSAAGTLHHDFYDFGAEGIGDNEAVAFGYADNYAVNAAQQMAFPWSNRLGVMVKPNPYIAMLTTYTSVTPEKNALNYEYYAKADIFQEQSYAIATETSGRNRLMGATMGYTQARKKDRFQKPTGNVSAVQTSFYVRQDISQHNILFAEAAYGCLRGDGLLDDCRIGWQMTKQADNRFYSMGFKHRMTFEKIFDHNIRTDPLFPEPFYSDGISDYFMSNLTYTDYSAGFLYQLNDSQNIGIEHILRKKQFLENVKISQAGGTVQHHYRSQIDTDIILSLSFSQKF